MKILKKIRTPIIFGVLIISALIVAYFIFNFNKSVKVEVLPVETVDIKKTVSASGSITSNKASDLAFNTTTKLVNLNVSENQFVEQNTLIAVGDTSSIYNNSQAAKAALEQAIVDREQFIEDYADNLEGIGGRENYELQLKRRVEAVNQAQFNYNATTSGYTNYNLTAPFSGTVIELFKEQGENIVAGSPVATLVDLTNLYFEALVDQEDISQIQIGQQVELSLDTYEEPLVGFVEEIPNYIDQSTGTIKVKIKVETPQGTKLFYGQTGDVDIATSTKENVQALQFDSFFSDEDDEFYLWVVENNELRKLPVTIGMEGDIYNEVLEDLSNVTVVLPTESSEGLEEGKRVNIVE